MFTSTATAAPTISTNTSSASPTSPNRTGRLRGLSYLRNYTHNHLHLPSSSHSSRPWATRASPVSAESPTSPTNTHSRPATRENSSLQLSDEEATRGRREQRQSTARSRLSDVILPTLQSLPALTAPTGTAEEERMGRDRSRSSRVRGLRASDAGPMAVPRERVVSSETAVNGSTNMDAALTEPAQPTTSAGEQLPSIRFIPMQELNGARPSLVFNPVSRTLPNPSSVIRVGRYSERDSTIDTPENGPSAAPVGFKSKVVSRRHCEFFYGQGQWYIKDVKSSSGTFLNHIRLSQPGVESRPYAIKDGDIVQLGIDFRGGEEMIFRCVKIKIECNRGWQKGLNNFNKSTHLRIRNLALNTSKEQTSDTASTTTSECSICLNAVAPCQSLFVAPCSHVWHFKCIRRMLNDTRNYPHFYCPNCRAMADLEADVDEPQVIEEWEEPMEDLDAIPPAANGETYGETSGTGAETTGGPQEEGGDGEDDSSVTRNLDHVSLHDDSGPQASPALSNGDSSSLANRPQTLVVPSNSIAIPRAIAVQPPSAAVENFATSPNGGPNVVETIGPDGPMTPRNDAGPFILDGSAGRNDARRVGSIDRAATQTPGEAMNGVTYSTGEDDE